jgi:hypothetical protein
MKKLSTYLFLIFFSFSTPSFADDIRDFQIEGMSVGDSLLDYMSEEEIKENVGFVYEDKKFTVSTYNKSSEIYDVVAIEYKSKDKTYKIHGVQGMIDFSNNIEGCYKKQDNVVKEISSMFTEINKDNRGILKMPRRKKGSTYKPIYFEFNSGDAISIECYHYSDVPEDDLLRITITSEELKEYLISRSK